MAKEIRKQGTLREIRVDWNHEYTFNTTSSTWGVANNGALTSGKFIYFDSAVNNIAYLGDFVFTNGALTSGDRYNHTSNIYRIAEDVMSVAIYNNGELQIISDGNNNGTVFGVSNSNVYGEVPPDSSAPSATDISTITTDITEGATIKVTADTTYDSSKQYIYYDSNSQIAIQDESHFNCIKNGYYSIADGINHYYTKSGNSYNYNAVPDVSTWADKWNFSNTITGKNLYSINSEANQIFIDGDGYYKKENNNYVKQTVKTYDLYKYNDSLSPISLTENNKYESDLDIDDDGNDIIIWFSSSNFNNSATDGYYLSIDGVQDINGNKTYNVELCYLTFDANGVATLGDSDGFLYKLNISSLDTTIDYYIKNGNNLVKLGLDTPITFATNPADTEILYVYQKLGSYTYPNTVAPETALLYTESGSTVYKDFNIDNFPVYTIATVTEISKTQHDSYTVYEKSAVKINYNYSTDANSLIPVYVSESAPLNNLSS